MVRRASLVGLAAALLTTAAGCWSSCGERRGLFMCRQPCEPPCQLVGRHGGFPVGQDPGYPIGAVPADAAVPGGAVPFPGSGGQPADVLPFPQPSGLIPPPGVPAAPPTAAPPPSGFEGASGSGLRNAQPVRGSTR